MENTKSKHEIAVDAAMKKFPKAKRIAVENFTYGSEGKGMTMGDSINLGADAACYKWNSHTVSAIRFVFNFRA